jgi:hypothetical protein
MTNDTLFRIIFGVLFVVVILVRRVFERRSAAVAEAGLAQDLDAGSLILVESLLLTLGNLGEVVGCPSWHYRRHCTYLDT